MEKIIVDPFYLHLLLLTVSFAMFGVGLYIMIDAYNEIKDLFKKKNYD